MKGVSGLVSLTIWRSYRRRESRWMWPVSNLSKKLTFQIELVEKIFFELWPTKQSAHHNIVCLRSRIRRKPKSWPCIGGCIYRLCHRHVCLRTLSTHAAMNPTWLFKNHSKKSTCICFYLKIILNYSMCFVISFYSLLSDPFLRNFSSISRMH